MRRIFLSILFTLCSFPLLSQDTEAMWRLYEQGQYHLLDAECKAALLKDPYNIQVNLVQGRSLADRGRDMEAIPYLERCTGVRGDGTWTEAWALVYLGTLYNRSGDQERSKKAFLQCLELNATRNVSEKAAALMRVYGFTLRNWTVEETANIRFHFPPNSVITNNRSRYMDSRQAAYDTVNKFFSAIVPGKIDMFIWNSNEQAGEELLRAPGFALSSERIIHSRYNQSRGHEITHILVHYGVEPVAQTRFINEGVAVFFDQNEGSKITRAKEFIREAEIGFSVVNFWEKGQEYDEGVLYPIAGAWVEFLFARLSKEEFLSVLKNQTYTACRTLLGDRLDAWVKEFEAEIRK